MDGKITKQLEFLNISFLGNTLDSWILASLLAIASPLIIRISLRYIAHKLQDFSETSKNQFDDVIVAVLANTKGFFYIAIALFLGTFALSLPAQLVYAIHLYSIAALLLQLGIWGTIAVGVLAPVLLPKNELTGAPSSATGLVSFIGKFLVWLIVLVVLLDNLGIDVTGLVAGLGIGGIAVALAVQNVLGDLLASLSIVLDDPFEVGDFVVVGDLSGTVERVGIKTTRLKSLGGEQLIFSNSDLLGSRIRNFKRMYERRVVFSLGVTYQTPKKLVEQIPGMIREVIENEKDTRFDRAHFKTFGSSAFEYEVVYYVLVPDYARFMDIQQSINFGVLQKFSDAGIEFAYPTQTLYLENVSNSS